MLYQVKILMDKLLNLINKIIKRELANLYFLIMKTIDDLAKKFLELVNACNRRYKLFYK